METPHYKSDPSSPQMSSLQKRKKASRACAACQKAHLTCDDERPCGRCMKRGISESCQDGLRKKAKYLQDQQMDISCQSGDLATPQDAFLQLDPNSYIPSTQFEPSHYDFGSHSMNMEYSMLSNMLGNTPSSESSATLPSPKQSHIIHNPSPRASTQQASTQTNPSAVYTSVTKPFIYIAGYHALNSYLRERFESSDLLRIARSISNYRPSFIALTQTLKEEDLIFMEKCFQRTLLEYDRFIGYSGTPTIIWRRTNQIAHVGKEFCLLTGWTKDDLLSKQTFIIELMNNHSVLNYFDRFSEHAFGDTSSSTSPVTLISKAGREILCMCCFTIKRDVFDMPHMIVGNFLPVLG
ncbi:Transcription activator of gluconeogenesis ERT1-1 [Neolecta irregularis DAH-3]|uniref:Transcription activator of gluconeogenesis ERT1-1 n=1 Tax=Neolecta irregularis (strain DAH-3) TaxID=1198029 RepID=A0A1U7LGD0_NEOID|nr:Transcription activator of gluconeogenesis ERT1-1 [Neolecta irregularis DAH-3]|eukprot:OLL21653.1 Transcription activator of gluconeogenesis ERT1-1 [Neolecta irregularis DAH-3]